MTAAGPSPNIFISVAEQSADEHAAGFLQAYRKRSPHAAFAGLTGPALRDAGCETFDDLASGSAMALAAFRRVPHALALLHRLRDYLATRHFDAAVLVDSPTLNLPIAGLCRRRTIPILYYIPPQTWAWAAWRNRRIRNRIDRLACIWPFEEQYFRDHGIQATYVGHPSFGPLLSLEIDPAQIAELRADAAPVLALLPGSREHVVREVLPGQLEVAQALARKFRRARFLLVPANEAVRRLIVPMVAKSSAARAIHVLPIRPDADLAVQRATAVRAADLVLVASGTATLEVAFHGTPMIVMYNSSRLAYHLFARWLISTEFLSIPNILAGRRLVPEFMPYYRSVDPIIATAVEWLSTPRTLARIRRELAEVITPIVKPGAAENAAAELDALLNETRARRSAAVP